MKRNKMLLGKIPHIHMSILLCSQSSGERFPASASASAAAGSNGSTASASAVVLSREEVKKDMMDKMFVYFTTDEQGRKESFAGNNFQKHLQDQEIDVSEEEVRAFIVKVRQERIKSFQ